MAVSSLGAKELLLVATLVVAVFLVYQPAWQGGFLWDDDIHLLNNPVLKPGGLAKVWVPGGYINYWPLTFTAYWLQFTIWGLNPLGFHLVNIAVHAVSALLLWRVLLRLRVPGAMFAAAIFALHPVNVESVAWISQLKGILSLMLALLSVLFFLARERQGGWWRLALAIGAFLLSTLAKGMVITLPVVLLACAWWQRGRIGRRDLLRVLPYLLIGAVMAGIEVWTQHLRGSGRRGALRQLLEPSRRCGLRRVVLPREADLAAGPVFRLSALADRRPRRAVLSARRAVGDHARAGVVAAPHLGPADRDADRLLRGAAVAGAGFCEHLLHALLAGGGSLAVCGHDRALRRVRRRGGDAGRDGAFAVRGPAMCYAWGCWRRWPS